MISKVKEIARSTILNTALKPPVVRHCSQTIYEALLGCCRMWEATEAPVWKERATALKDTLLSIQRPDGGFDIGYDFNFGRMHKKGQSTSPELLGLLALCEYDRVVVAGQVGPAAERAATWIRTHSQDLGNDRAAIPYSPLTTKEIMVYNGTSFACGALGCYLGQFGGDGELTDLYRGMVHYLDGVLAAEGSTPGRFWHYNDQSRTDLTEQQRRKVDYYHQMQQVEVHAKAQQVCPQEAQLRVIRDASDHILALLQRHPVLPYTNDPQNFNNQIHLWGLASVAPGFLEASLVLPDRRTEYHAAARSVLEWVVKYGWRGDRFSPVLSHEGSPAVPDWYMVRSDAWVFGALASAELHLGKGPWSDVVETCFERMSAVDFSGPESHATCLRRQVFGKAIVIGKGILGR